MASDGKRSRYRLDFNRKETETFIDLYREREILWNASRPDYTCRVGRYSALVQIGAGFKKKVTVDQVTRKIANLRTTYSRELRKMLMSQEGGQCYVPQWDHFNILDAFLRPFTNPRPPIYEHPTQPHVKRERIDNDLTVWPVHSEDQVDLALPASLNHLNNNQSVADHVTHGVTQSVSSSAEVPLSMPVFSEPSEAPGDGDNAPGQVFSFNNHANSTQQQSNPSSSSPYPQQPSSPPPSSPYTQQQPNPPSSPPYSQAGTEYHRYYGDQVDTDRPSSGTTHNQNTMSHPLSKSRRKRRLRRSPKPNRQMSQLSNQLTQPNNHLTQLNHQLLSQSSRQLSQPKRQRSQPNRQLPQPTRQDLQPLRQASHNSFHSPAHSDQGMHGGEENHDNLAEACAPIAINTDRDVHLSSPLSIFSSRNGAETEGQSELGGQSCIGSSFSRCSHTSGSAKFVEWMAEEITSVTDPSLGRQLRLAIHQTVLAYQAKQEELDMHRYHGINRVNRIN